MQNKRVSNSEFVKVKEDQDIEEVNSQKQDQEESEAEVDENESSCSKSKSSSKKSKISLLKDSPPKCKINRKAQANIDMREILSKLDGEKQQYSTPKKSKGRSKKQELETILNTTHSIK